MSNLKQCLEAYNLSRRTANEPQAAIALVSAVSASSEPMTRELFDACFWAISLLKKTAKPAKSADGAVTGNRTEFLERALELVSLVDRLKEIGAPNNKLKDNQIGPYLWALYAVAECSQDAKEAKTYSAQYIKAYEARRSRGWKPESLDEKAFLRMQGIAAPNGESIMQARREGRAGNVEKCIQLYHEAMSACPMSPDAIDDYCWNMVKSVWAKPPAGMGLVQTMMTDFLKIVNNDSINGGVRESWHRFFVGLVKRLKAEEKSGNGNGAILSFPIARLYVEICDKFGFRTFGQDDFARRPVTAEQRAGMERRSGRRIRLKEWPSNVDEAVGVAARCIKAHQGDGVSLKPGETMVGFLREHVDKSEWFGFYYARWLKLIGRSKEAVKYLADVVRRKKNDDWAWLYLGDSFEDEFEKARACYCRSLTCPVHDKEIAEGIAKKTHRRLAAVLRKLGQIKESQEEEALALVDNALPGNRDFYMRYANEARRFMYIGENTLEFEGRFEKLQDKPFGFVRFIPQEPHQKISIFVPPALAKSISNGTAVKGLAIQQMDEKKKRMSWTAEDIQAK